MSIEVEVAQRWNVVDKCLRQVCERVGRKRESVELIAVSKKKPVEMITAAIRVGQLSFGENYVQELVEKIDYFDSQMASDSQKLRWHYIGSLQSNKAKYIVGRVECIHSVDSLTLAKEIDKQAGKKNCIQNVLLQVNLAFEESKGGVSESQLKALVEEVKKLKNIHVAGLMIIPPVDFNENQLRQQFRKLQQLAKEHNLNELSMGMSHDFSIAVEEGATMVRVGTSIFGERV